MRISGKNINFDDKKVKKYTFYKNKKINKIDDTDVNKILVSKKEPYGTKNSSKYFVGYNDNDIIRPLYVRLPEMTGHARKFDENATVPFKVNNKQEKVKKLLNVDFESKPVYGDDDKYMKIKIKIYAGSIITNFHNKKIPKEKAQRQCLLIIMIDSVIKANKKYYPETFLEECKYIQEKIKIENYTDEDLEKSESDRDYKDETESHIDNDE